MGQVNINRPADTGDRTGAAGVNFVAVLIGLVVVVALVVFMFTALGRSGPTSSGSQPAQQPQAPAPNININPPAPPAPNININPPGSGPQQAPSAPQQAPNAR
jgi:hypothetical protein